MSSSVESGVKNDGESAIKHHPTSMRNDMPIPSAGSVQVHPIPVSKQPTESSNSNKGGAGNFHPKTIDVNMNMDSLIVNSNSAKKVLSPLSLVSNSARGSSETSKTSIISGSSPPSLEARMQPGPEDEVIRSQSIRSFTHPFDDPFDFHSPTPSSAPASEQKPPQHPSTLFTNNNNIHSIDSTSTRDMLRATRAFKSVNHNITSSHHRSRSDPPNISSNAAFAASSAKRVTQSISLNHDADVFSDLFQDIFRSPTHANVNPNIPSHEVDSVGSSPIRQHRNEKSGHLTPQMIPVPLNSPVSLSNNTLPTSISTSTFDMNENSSEHSNNTNSRSRSSIIVPPSPQASDISREICLSSAHSDVSNNSSRGSFNSQQHTHNMTTMNLTPTRNTTSTSATNSQQMNSIQGTPSSASKRPFLPNLQQDNNANAVMLGLQQLERQQAEHEARQNWTSVASQNMYLPTTIHMPNGNNDTGYMTPVKYGQAQGINLSQASWNNGNLTMNPPTQELPNSRQGSGLYENLPEIAGNKDKATRSFGKMKWLPNRKRTESFPEAPKHELYDENDDKLEFNSTAIVYGYLHKLNQSGVWQRRFFETDGESLSYYKSSRRKKLLASLDIIKVGDISVNLEDSTGCTFQIQVAGRPYFLKAENSGICHDWVINLNRVREARIQLGGMKLVAEDPASQTNPTNKEGENKDRKHSESSTDMVVRVTVEANRKRSKKVNGIFEYVANIQNDEIVLPRDFLAKFNKRERNFIILRSRLASFVRWWKAARCLGKQNDVVVMNPVPESTIHERQSSGFYNVYEERTADDSELSSRASGSFDHSRTQMLLQGPVNGGDASMKNLSRRQTDNDPNDVNSMASEPSPKFSHEKVASKKRIPFEEERRMLS